MKQLAPCPTLDRSAVLEWLRQHVPKPRVQHILRVEAYAQELAHHHGLDPVRAAQAGLLHDLAKYFKPERLLALAQTEGISLDPITTADPHLLHAEVSAIAARDQFQVQDADILEAIRNHTLGQPAMSPLSCVVFLADSLEPGRGSHADLKLLRKASRICLYQGVWLTCDRTLNHLMQTQKPIHPRMVLTRNWAMQAANATTKK